MIYRDLEVFADLMRSLDSGVAENLDEHSIKINMKAKPLSETSCYVEDVIF